MKLAVTQDELNAMLAGVPFAESYGFRVIGIGDGRCTVLVPFRRELERPGGLVAGAAFMAAADVAMWLAIKTRLGLDDASVTAEMKTSFLNSARNEEFHCAARLLKCGRRLIYGVAECVGEKGALLTHHTLTYIRNA
ncbi:MAG TPA: PaaI family thioesterase [Bryobacteraceae bacterium]|nr:PaaI family thioesterase [Bryobacteraceae bacterium]